MRTKKIRCAYLLMLVVCLFGCTHSAPPAKMRSADAWSDAKKAIEEGNTTDATQFAKQMLAENTDRKSWAYGNCVHEGNQILGLAALKEGRAADAKRYLIAAGQTPGSPQLDSFGPHMVLAQQLLEHGEKEAVIQYLDLVSHFWATTSDVELKRMERKKPGIAVQIQQSDRENQILVDQWKKQIRAGGRPTLNNSGGLF